MIAVVPLAVAVRPAGAPGAVAVGRGYTIAGIVVNTSPVNRKPTAYNDGPELFEGDIKTCPKRSGGTVPKSSTKNALEVFAGTFTVALTMVCIPVSNIVTIMSSG